MTFAIAVCGWLLVVGWLIATLRTQRALLRQTSITVSARPHGDLFENEPAAFISIIVPARNEAHRVLRQSIVSMLSQDYVDYEIVAVDDRSTDDTLSILQQLAAHDTRLTVVIGDDPPKDWIGKPHALWQAFNQTRGDWILATDADMLFAPQALSSAMAYANQLQLDALSFIPKIDCLSFWECVFMPMFGWIIMSGLPIEHVNDPKRNEACGVGGFFLIKRAALVKAGGYEAVRSEVAEDMRMAELLKQSGARFRLEYALDLARTRMQTNFAGLWEGFSKNMFAGFRFSVPRSVAASLFILLTFVAPAFIAWSLVGISLFANANLYWLALPFLLVHLLQILMFIALHRKWSVHTVYALTTPLGFVMFVAILANSTIRVLSGHGVVWKGRSLYGRHKDPDNDESGTDQA